MNHQNNHLSLLSAGLLVLLLASPGIAVIAQDLMSVSSQMQTPPQTAEATSTTDDSFPPAAQARVEIVTSTLNIYAGPGASYAITGRVKRGETYEIVDQRFSCGWLEISAGERTLGWISSNADHVSTDVVCGMSGDLPVKRSVPRGAEVPRQPASAETIPVPPQSGQTADNSSGDATSAATVASPTADQQTTTQDDAQIGKNPHMTRRSSYIWSRVLGVVRDLVCNLW